MPPRMFIRVDLPAPLTPTMPHTLPGCAENETSFSALTPGKVLLICFSSRDSLLSIDYTPFFAACCCRKEAIPMAPMMMPPLISVV